ncbi:AHH domain-containing protein, partial [Pseudomonas aegrilactucae]
GLCSKKLDAALGGTPKDDMQAHHLIPQKVWRDEKDFFEKIGMSEDMDKKENGLLMPDSADKAKKMKRVFYHCGPHSKVYTPMVERMIGDIQDDLDKKEIDEAGARARIASMQNRLRAGLSVSGGRQRRVR